MTITHSGKLSLCVLIFGCMHMFSCSTTTYREVYPLLADGKYDSEFPYRGCSEQLELISESVRMVSCVAYYKSYVFPPESKVRRSDLRDPFIKEKMIKEVFLNRSASGSATVIYCQDKRVALLTCAHIIDFADTVFTYYHGEDRKQTEFIQSLDVKDHQAIYVATIQGARDLEILAIDKENDLAVIGQKIEGVINPLSIREFNFPIGSGKELEWGAFVYLFGYPSGYRIVTKAIVSNPNRDKEGSFLIDAVTNRGFSGGIVLAIRDGVPNFELVGMIKMVPGQQKFYLAPGKEEDRNDYDTNTPFRGDAYIESRTDFIYGVTTAISSELIVKFIESHRRKFLEKGYDLRTFIEKKNKSKQN